MRAYLATTGTLFVLLALVHVWRAFEERHLARDPWFILTTLIAAALSAWALTLFRQNRSSR